MSDNHQQNHNSEHTGDGVPMGNTRKFKYKPRSVYSVLLRKAEYNLGDIDAFFERTKKARRSEQKDLEQMAARSGENVPDDWLYDDREQLTQFSWLYAEFAIIDLWRCIELYRKSAMRAALGDKAAKRSYKHKLFQEDLSCLKIEETKIRCARSVDELRCLNNSIKHERQVGVELAKFPLWQNKEDDELGDLESHYNRLRPFAKQYLEDLMDRLNNTKIPNPNLAGRVSKT